MTADRTEEVAAGRWRLLAVALAVLAECSWWLWQSTRHMPIDLSIYAWGGHAVAHDALLYQVRAFGHWFTYPPFAAVGFMPIAGLPPLAERWVWALASLAALCYVCRACWQLAGRPASTAVTFATMAVALVLEPVWHTLVLGQINLLLLALVLWDMQRIQRNRVSGFGIGLAAAIKLTPGLFVVVLALSGRRRAAAVASGTFALCTAIGLAVAPSASATYWRHLFFDTGRVGAPFISNQSPYGAAVRLLNGVAHVGGWYVVVPLSFVAVGVATATVFARQDDWLAATVATGVTTLLVSPISWTHHWVWVIPALVLLVNEGGTRRRVAAGVAIALFALAPLWWTPHFGGPAEYGFHGVVSLVANSYLIAGVVMLAYLAAAARLCLRRRRRCHSTNPTSRTPAPIAK